MRIPAVQFGSLLPPRFASTIRELPGATLYNSPILLAAIAAISALYGSAGQAGGSGFVAVMSFASLSVGTIRMVAFGLNIVAAAYATARVHRAGLVDWRLIAALVLTSVLAAFVGGLLALDGKAYFLTTGAILFAVSILMVRQPRSQAEEIGSKGMILALGGGTGLASGISGVGGGVFLSALLIIFCNMPPKKVVALSPPFILINSAAALAGGFLAGQRIPVEAAPLALVALLGSVVGVAIGFRWMSGQAVRYVLALILVAGSLQMFLKVF